jgi:sulfonate transport system ATP-binding protein
MTPLLEVAIADKAYGDRAVLRQLTLDQRAGEVVSLIGASGCGKSTLLSIIAGLDRDYRGRVLLDGQAVHGASPDIGFIFQEPRLFPWLTVAQNIRFGAAGRGIDPARIEALLNEVGLAGYGERLPKQLSGGQAQRVAIARGLYTQPRLLLLDEPFSAVDAFTRMKLQDLLSTVAQRYGLTVLLVTHDLDEALYLSDRVVLLDAAAGPARASFNVDTARPRARDGARTASLKSEILAQLHSAHAI